MTTRIRAPKRWTRLVYHVGSLLGGAALAVAVLLEVLGRPSNPGSLVDPAAIVAGIAGATSWGWAALGVWLVIITPAVGLMTTLAEFRAIADRRATLTTLTVLLLLAGSLVVALLRGHGS